MGLNGRGERDKGGGEGGGASNVKLGRGGFLFYKIVKLQIYL